MEHEPTSDNDIALAEPTEANEPPTVLPSVKKHAKPRRKPKLFERGATPTGARKATDPVQVGVQRTKSLLDLGFFVQRRGAGTEPLSLRDTQLEIKIEPASEEESEDSGGDVELASSETFNRDKPNCDYCGTTAACGPTLSCAHRVAEHHEKMRIKFLRDHSVVCKDCQHFLSGPDHRNICICEHCLKSNWVPNTDCYAHCTFPTERCCHYGGPKCYQHGIDGGRCDIRSPQASGTPQRETTEGREVVPDLPQARQGQDGSQEDSTDEGGDVVEAEGQVQGQPLGVFDSNRKTPGRDSPRPHPSTPCEATVNTGQELLRLRCCEAWQLPSCEEPLRNLQLSSQVGYSPGNAWLDPRSLQRDGQEPDSSEKEEDLGWWKPYAIESSEVCERYTIWVLPQITRDPRPSILYAQQVEDRKLLFYVCSPTEERLKATLARSIKLQGNRSAHVADRRMVELQYKVHTKFSSASVVRKWAKAALQDDDGGIAQAILDDIRDATQGKLLRHVSERLLRHHISGRVPRPHEDYRRMEPMVTGERHVSSEERVTIPEGGQPSLHLSIELDPPTSLCQSVCERPSEAGTPVEQTVPDRTPEPSGHKRLRRSSRLAGLITNEELHSKSRATKKRL